MTWYASGWKNVPSMSSCESVTSNPKRIIASRSNQMFSLNLMECKDDIDPTHEVNYIEQVQAFVTLLTDRRGEIEIYLYSPSNTKTQLLPVRISYLVFIERKMTLFREENVIKVIKVFKIGLF